MADSLVKAIARHGGELALAPCHDHLVCSVKDRTAQWAWLFCKTQANDVQLPFLSARGTWLNAAAVCQPSTFPADMGFGRATGSPVATTLRLSVVQYNCLSLKGGEAVQMMQAGLRRQKVHLAGLQETRMRWDGISQQGDFWVVSSPCNSQGVGGCQLSLNRNRSVGTSGTTALNCNRQSFALLVRDPQLLVMLAKAGGIKLALVSGHAPTAKAPEDVRQAWWDLLASALRRVPATYAPLLMLDANARFSSDPSSPSSMDSQPDGPNAESLQALCGDFGLYPSAQFDPAGRPLVSWVSPQGRESLIDYFVCPGQWAAAMRVEQCPSLDDLHATIDHRPLRLCLDLTLDSISPSCRRRIDVRALHTAEGLSAVERALRTMPLVPWEVDSTTHVALLHTHLRGSLAASLPVPKSRPRNLAYSEATIDLVRAKRRTRKRVRELYAQERAYILEAVFTVWARRSPPLVELDSAATMPVLSECRRHRTRVLAILHCQEGLLRTKMKADKAAFLREEMQQARDLGSAHFAHRIRSVLRMGRKFKAPALLSTLFPHTDAEAAGQEAVMHAMGTHYALAERATESTTIAQLSRRCEAPTCPLDAVLVAQDMPSLPALARSIAGIQCRKASGISGIPPDVYRLAPHLSAIALFPLQ